MALFGVYFASNAILYTSFVVFLRDEDLAFGLAYGGSGWTDRHYRVSAITDGVIAVVLLLLGRRAWYAVFPPKVY